MNFDESRLRDLSLDKEVDVNRKNESGKSPLCYLLTIRSSCLLRLLEIYLLRNSVDLTDSFGWNPLAYVCYFFKGDCNLLDIIQLLLHHKADINGIGAEGSSPILSFCSRPFEGAVEPKFWEILKALIDAGADVRLKDAPCENALVKLTNSRFAHPDYYAMASLLIDHGADVNGKCVDGCTPLLYISVFYSGPDLINIVRMID